MSTNHGCHQAKWVVLPTQSQSTPASSQAEGATKTLPQPEQTLGKNGMYFHGPTVVFNNTFQTPGRYDYIARFPGVEKALKELGGQSSSKSKK